MRIDENTYSNPSLDEKNARLSQKCNELNQKLIIYKDRNHSMVKAIVILSIITFVLFVILVICGYNYTYNLADKTFKLSEHEKMVQEQKENSKNMSKQIEDYEYQIKDQDKIIKQLREDNNNLSNENSDLKSKMLNMRKTIDNQKDIIERYRNNSDTEVNQ